MLALLDASWRFFDEVVAGAPGRLRKGPRGGGRDRDAIVEHVGEAEIAYARKIGLGPARASGGAEPARAIRHRQILDRIGGGPPADPAPGRSRAPARQ